MCNKRTYGATQNSTFGTISLFLSHSAMQRSQPQLAAIAPLGEGLQRGTCQDTRPNRVDFSSSWLGMKRIRDCRKETPSTDSFCAVPLLYVNE